MGGEWPVVTTVCFHTSSSCSYTTLIKHRLPNDENVNMGLFFGYIGALNSAVLWPGLLLMSRAELEKISAKIMLWILVKGLFDNVLSDYLWARAVVLTSPTVATVGLSLTIPMAIVSDLLVKGLGPTVLSVLGAVLVLLGFFCVNFQRRTAQGGSAAVGKEAEAEPGDLRQQEEERLQPEEGARGSGVR